MDREALGTYKGVFEHMGFLGHQVVSKCMEASKHMGVSRCPPNIWGVNTMPPSVKVTCH